MRNSVPKNVREEVLKAPSAIILPLNLKARLDALHEPLTSLLDVTRLTSILSKDDVSFYLWCQYSASRLFFKPVVETLGFERNINSEQLNDYYPKFYELDVAASLKEIKDKTGLDVSPSETDSSFDTDEDEQPTNVRPLYDGLFSTLSGGLRLADYAFETTEITPECFGLSLVPVNNLETRSKQLLHSYEELLSHLRRYVPLSDLGLTSLFSEFCQISMA